jgi:hypothetical protein
MPSVEEIDNLIAELHKQGKGTRKISAVIHKNFSYVGARLRVLFPGEFPDTGANNALKVSNETRALKMFSLKRTPTEVAIELNESPDSVERYFSNFWRLERMEALYRIYTENRKAIPYLLSLFNLLRKKAIPYRLYNQVFDFVERELVRRGEEISFSNDHVYTAEELEEAFHKETHGTFS